MSEGRQDLISLKSRAELEKMRVASRIVAQTLEAAAAAVRPGITTGELDRIAFETIRGAGAQPSFKGYRIAPHVPRFPATICASVNEELVHGIPGRRVLRAEDIVSIDVGAIWQGYHGDAAITLPVGDPQRDMPPETRRLLEVTNEALFAGIGAARNGRRLGDISAAIQQVIERGGFAVAGGGYGGHGVGRRLHEAPHVANEGLPGRGPLLQPGMTLALEPMANAGRPETRVLRDRWTVATADGKRCAHFEHTICVTEDAAEILTRLEPRVYERIGVRLPALAEAAGVG
ncbi:MAG TPA: type I methionyl aminopeptidase [Chloroflexota bacterium]|nr:type I methionyl aminopeptidase [Chloroflexota bacterium]